MTVLKQNQTDIIYPFETSFSYKNKQPFLCATQNSKTYYLCKGKGIYRFNPQTKEFLELMPNVTTIEDTHEMILSQAVKAVRGIHYQLIAVFNHHYLCIGHIHNHENSLCLVLLTIDLTTQGYYEIINVLDVFRLKKNTPSGVFTD